MRWLKCFTSDFIIARYCWLYREFKKQATANPDKFCLIIFFSYLLVYPYQGVQVHGKELLESVGTQQLG
jgi:hypothetical protein